MYRVNEIFYSLQGEGRWSGTPMVFLRFSLCNLNCPFCDTDFSSSRELSLDDIISRVKTLAGACRRVCVTGGEPSLQLDNALVDALHRNGFTIHIETNGTRPLPEGLDWITCSPKADWMPGAEVVLPRMDEVKVVFTGQDPERWLRLNSSLFFLQPCSCANTVETLSYILGHPQWSLSLQTHKYLDIR